MNRVCLFAGGFLVLILGMTLVIRHWDDAVRVFYGVVPGLIAVCGLVLMFAASLKK